MLLKFYLNENEQSIIQFPKLCVDRHFDVLFTTLFLTIPENMKQATNCICVFVAIYFVQRK